MKKTLPDKLDKFGGYGGRFAPEVLMPLRGICYLKYFKYNKE